jgi:hypothetical protein
MNRIEDEDEDEDEDDWGLLFEFAPLGWPGNPLALEC